MAAGALRRGEALARRGRETTLCDVQRNPYKRRGIPSPAAQPNARAGAPFPRFFMPSAIVLIPARMAATRLPGKPLADIAGTPMIVHVMRRAVAADVGPVFVATEDKAIADAIGAAGGKAI